MSNANELVEKYKIFECISGSHAYGLNTPESDVDTRGIFIAPPEYILSCHKSIEQVSNDSQDMVFYELRKFMKLAAECNPNIIELLYLDPSSIKFQGWQYSELIHHRDLFLSKKARHTFSGYAIAQLKRIRGHKKWLMMPQPEEPPKIRDYCKMIINGQVESDPKILEDYSSMFFLVQTFSDTNRDIFRIFHQREFFKEKIGFFDEKENNLRYINIDQKVLEEREAHFVGVLFCNLTQFQEDTKKWKQYWDWKNNRNEKRAKIEAEVGYDAKHAMHLVRLMRQCEEILTTGTLTVKRPDREELLEIRSGRWPYEKLIEWAETMDKKFNDLYDKSSLRFSADYEEIDQLYRNICLESWRSWGLYENS